LLLQLARPEAVFFNRRLPKAYIVHYLLHQEHFSLLRFIGHLAKSTVLAPAPRDAAAAAAAPSRKWILFTRSSDLLRLPQELVLQPLVAC
jgi:hypothetical protein